MFKHITTYCFLFLILVLFSCKDSNKNLPESVGKLGSLAIVADEGVNKAVSGQMDAILLKDDETITGGSPFSELLKPDPDEFFKFFSNQKTILVLVTKDHSDALSELLSPFTKEEMEQLMDNPKPQLKTRSDLFARHQHLVYLFANDLRDLENKLHLAENNLKNILVESEIKDQYFKVYEDSVNVNSYFNEIKKELGLGFKVPNGFNLLEHRDGFWWFEWHSGAGPKEQKMGLIAHSYDYKDSLSDFTYNAICSVRDTFLKYHIKGDIKGTYMGTSKSEQYPARYISPVTINGNQGFKVRAWWNIDGIMMSGPFIRYVLKVPGAKKLFVFEGFIYKPELNVKEKELRTIESIALSIH